MPILKFTHTNGEVSLQNNLRLEDITNDNRTKFVNKNALLQKKYKIGPNIYLAQNDVFFSMAKMLNKDKKDISAMVIKEGDNVITIVPPKSYVFWNGLSVEAEKYEVLENVGEIIKKLMKS